MAKSNRLMARVVKLLPRTCGPGKELRGANKMREILPLLASLRVRMTEVPTKEHG